MALKMQLNQSIKSGLRGALAPFALASAARFLYLRVDLPGTARRQCPKR
jgi:hypothetical protein